MHAAVALQKPTRLLQHLFYFIAHATTALRHAYDTELQTVLQSLRFIYCDETAEAGTRSFHGTVSDTSAVCIRSGSS